MGLNDFLQCDSWLITYLESNRLIDSTRNKVNDSIPYASLAQQIMESDQSLTELLRLFANLILHRSREGLPMLYLENLLSYVLPLASVRAAEAIDNPWDVIKVPVHITEDIPYDYDGLLSGKRLHTLQVLDLFLSLLITLFQPQVAHSLLFGIVGSNDLTPFHKLRYAAHMIMSVKRHTEKRAQYMATVTSLLVHNIKFVIVTPTSSLQVPHSVLPNARCQTHITSTLVLSKISAMEAAEIVCSVLAIVINSLGSDLWNRPDDDGYSIFSGSLHSMLCTVILYMHLELRECELLHPHVQTSVQSILLIISRLSNNVDYVQEIMKVANQSDSIYQAGMLDLMPYAQAFNFILMLRHTESGTCLIPEIPKMEHGFSLAPSITKSSAPTPSFSIAFSRLWSPLHIQKVLLKAAFLLANYVIEAHQTPYLEIDFTVPFNRMIESCVESDLAQLHGSVQLSDSESRSSYPMNLAHSLAMAALYSVTSGSNSSLFSLTTLIISKLPEHEIKIVIRDVMNHVALKNLPSDNKRVSAARCLVIEAISSRSDRFERAGLWVNQLEYAMKHLVAADRNNYLLNVNRSIDHEQVISLVKSHQYVSSGKFKIAMEEDSLNFRYPFLLDIAISHELA